METVYDEELPVLKRIKIPMVWERMACGICIKDLQPDKYDVALDIIQNHFLDDDPLCKASAVLSNDVAVQEYQKVALHWMLDTQSFLAVEDGTDRAVGVLIGSVNERDAYTNAMNGTRIYQSIPMNKMQKFLAHIHKQVNQFELFSVEALYEVYIWCVVREYRNRGIGKALLRTGLEQTSQFRLSAAMGIFTGAVSQYIAENMGFQTQHEILYWEWKDGDKAIFDNPGPGNKSANFMVKRVDPADINI
uniref:N-acetyltransferase domain-containing protein n=1 Tax=Cuerna arida TaxID=1464854 RepID=A0A1B6GLA4_9HEMI